VARFVGSANILSGTVTEVEAQTVTLKCHGGQAFAARSGAQVNKGQAVTIAVRSERVNLTPCTNGEAHGLLAVVKEKSFSGGVLHIIVSLEDGSELVSSRHGIDSPLAVGDKVTVNWESENAVLVDLEAAG
jgi:spermidine/putrescine transport system ATP-binding protein